MRTRTTLGLFFVAAIVSCGSDTAGNNFAENNTTQNGNPSTSCDRSSKCGEGLACVEGDGPGGMCAPIDGGGELVEGVLVDTAPFAEGCVTQDDCVLVRPQFECTCGYEGCLDAAVLKENHKEFLDAYEAAKDTCTPDLHCEGYSIDCFDEEDRAACIDSVCVNLREDQADCLSDSECTGQESDRCVLWGDEERYISAQCGECMFEVGVQGFYSMPEMPACLDGTYCSADDETAFTCQPKVACTTSADCEDVQYPNRESLVCIGGLCESCRTDADCGEGERCVADAPLSAPLDEAANRGLGNGCWPADSDEACFDWSCPYPCQERDGKWTC